jgi:hypothetical protein
MKTMNNVKKLALPVILLLLSASAWCQKTTPDELRLRVGGAATALGFIQHGGTGPSLIIGGEWARRFKKHSELTVSLLYSNLWAELSHDDPDGTRKKDNAMMLTIPVNYRFNYQYFYLTGGVYLDLGPGGITAGPGVGLGFDFPIVSKLYAGIYGNGRIGVGLGAIIKANAGINLSYRFSL